jgi:hypothetical protein
MLYRCCLILFLSITVPNLVVQAQESPGHLRLMTGGTLVAIHGDSISIKNSKRTSIVRVNSDTDIWRGGTVSLHELHPRDRIDVAYYLDKGNGEMVAIEIDANIDNRKGTITRIAPHTITIAEEDEDGSALGPATILFDDHTDFGGSSEKDLKVGQWFQAVGLDLGNHRMRATKVLTALSLPEK